MLMPTFLPPLFSLRAGRYAALGRRGARLGILAAFACGLACPATAQTASYKLGDLLIQAPWARATPAGAKGGGAGATSRLGRAVCAVGGGAGAPGTRAQGARPTTGGEGSAEAAGRWVARGVAKGG